MIRIVHSDGFLRSAKRLPQSTREKLTRLLTLCNDNPFHPLLHTKKLSGELAGLYSFRITRDWRVIFQFTGSETIRLLRVGDRKDVYA